MARRGEGPNILYLQVGLQEPKLFDLSVNGSEVLSYFKCTVK